MADLSTPARHEHSWRILLLDRDPNDPKWLLATVTLPVDVRPRRPGRRWALHTGCAEVTAWVHGQLGHRGTGARPWRADVASGLWSRREP
jgi:hypothetical protein